MNGKESPEEALRIIESFSKLPIDKKVDVFRQLSAQARKDLVESVPQAQEIIRRVSEEEMFFTIKELGEESALSLVRMTTSRQLCYLLDIDLWKNDMFHTDSAARWIHLMATIGEEKILQFVQSSDPELLVTMLSRFVKVYTRNPDVDLVEERDYLPAFSLDDTFYVEFIEPDSDEVLKSVLETIFAWNTQFYFGLMRELAFGIANESEEHALKFRRARLADRGFPEFEEALEIYQYLHRKTLSTGAVLSCSEDAEEDYASLLEYPLKTVPVGTLFQRSMDLITVTADKDRLCRELAHLANKVMVADGRDPGVIDELYGSLKKVSGYINIALEEACGENEEQAADFMRAHHMELLFRRGFSLILDIRKEAQSLLRECQGGVENLGYPLAGLLKGLIQPRPVFCNPTSSGEKSREFGFLEDVQQIRRMMQRDTLDDAWEPI